MARTLRDMLVLELVSLVKPFSAAGQWYADKSYVPLDSWTRLA